MRTNPAVAASAMPAAATVPAAMPAAATAAVSVDPSRIDCGENAKHQDDRRERPP